MGPKEAKVTPTNTPPPWVKPLSVGEVSAEQRADGNRVQSQRFRFRGVAVPPVKLKVGTKHFPRQLPSR
jgi:hypothetical protein